VSTQRVDVVVVGAGLAGLTAARELGWHGRDVVVLEGRDRLGGRAWTAPFAGIDVEMGGAYVHWIQPHLWSELTRYGLGIVGARENERTTLRGDDGVVELDGTDFEDVASSFEALCRDAPSLIPNPMAPPEGDEVRAADRLSARDRLDATDMPSRVRGFVDAMCAGISSRPNDEVGYLTIAKTFALASFDRDLMLAANVAFTIEGGTSALVEAIADDVRGEIRTGRPVEAISQDGGEVLVRTSEGETVASAAVVAVPENTLGAIAFEPGLSATKVDAAERGIGGLGVKVWAKLAGGSWRGSASAPDRFPLTFVEAAGPTPDGGTAVVGFGPSAAAVPLADPDLVAKEIEEMLPGEVVEEVGGHDWVDDPFSRGTWAAHRPDTWIRWLPEIDRPEGRIAFAGADIARGWQGYLDGAIETGLSAAREADAILG
jgi:pseudooxynicotine oxidase